MAQFKLDPLDFSILAHLQEDGRMTNVELAQRIGMTPPPCLRRVKALEEAGIIENYQANLNLEMLGYSITAFAMISLKSNGDDLELNNFEDQMRKLPEIRECYFVNGDIDFIAKVVTKDLKSFRSFLTDQLLANPSVDRVRSAISINMVKRFPDMPLEHQQMKKLEGAND